MKKKLWLTLLTVLLAVSMGFTVLFAAASQADYSGALRETADIAANGASSLYRGVTYGVGPANKDFYRGTDVDGNLFFQQVRSESNFQAYSDRQIHLNGLNATFRIEQLYEGRPIASGANWSVGLHQGGGSANGADEVVGLTFVYDAEKEAFDLFMNTREKGFWPYKYYGSEKLADGTPITDATGELGQYAIGDFVRPTLGADINVRLLQLSSAEATALGVKSAKNGNFYYWFVNGCLIDIPVVWAGDQGTSAFLPRWIWNGDAVHFAQDDGGDYGTFVFWDNEFNRGIATPGFAGTTAEDGRSARVTFWDVSGTGTLGGAPVSGFESVSGSGFAAGVATGGAYKGAKVFRPEKAGTGWTAALAATSDLKAAEAVVGLEYNLPRGEQSAARILYTADGTLEGDRFGLELKKSGQKLALRLHVNGTSYVVAPAEIDFDFGSAPLIVTTMLGGEAPLLLVNSMPLELSEEAAAALETAYAGFADGKGQLVFDNPSGDATMALVSTVDDGTATKKVIFKSLKSALTDLTVDRFLSVEELKKLYPATVEYSTDATGEAAVKEVEVTWSDTVAPVYPGIYTVTGTIANLAELEADFYVSDTLKKALTFRVTVRPEEDYVLYQGSDYATLKSRWNATGGGANDFLYRRDGDWECFLADMITGSSGGKFMPGYDTAVDVDGFELELKLNSFSDKGGVFGFFLSSITGTSGHPVQAESSGRHFGLWLNRLPDTPTKGYVNFQFGYYQGGRLSETAQEATLYDAEAGTWSRYFDMDWTGQTPLKLKTTLTDDEFAVYFEVGGKLLKLTKDRETKLPDGIAAMMKEKFAGGKMYPQIWEEGSKLEVFLKMNYTEYIVSYQRPADKIVDYYAEHRLPATVKATLNSGREIDAQITYEGNYDKARAGDYVLTGKLAAAGIGKAGVLCEGVEDRFEVKVTVKNETLIIKSFEKQPTVEVEEGQTPTFVTTMEVEAYSEAREVTEKRTVTLTWSSDDFNRLIPGTYTFRAAAEGNYVFDESLADQIVCAVTVKAPAPEKKSGCNSAAGSLGVALLLAAAACKFGKM